ncbi:MAG: hypothetical protein RLZZ623_633 [Actinomycetota bacterium]
MRSGTFSHVALVAMLVIVGLGAPTVSADDVGDQQRRVNQIADELDALDNQLGQLEEDHAAAMDRIDVLAVDIQQSQAKVDAQSAELQKLQGQLTSIALDKFMSGGSAGLTPLFSSAATFSEILQRGELTRVALDQGAGTSDEMASLITDLAAETNTLEAKKAEQAKLVASLETQQQQGEALTVVLNTKFAAANAELGDLVTKERERRVAAAVAAAQAKENRRAAAAAASAAAATPSVRGGGAPTPATGDGNGGGTAGGGGGAAAAPSAPDPTPAPSAPAPSSMSGVAVAAAQGQLGVPYRFAAESPGVAFDCSGLTKYAWGKAGVGLPHQSGAQYASTPHVSKDQVQPGDLIFYKSPIGHVAIYIGGGMMIHAPATGDVVKVSAVNWAKVVGVSRPG